LEILASLYLTIPSRFHSRRHRIRIGLIPDIRSPFLTLCSDPMSPFPLIFTETPAPQYSYPMYHNLHPGPYLTKKPAPHSHFSLSLSSTLTNSKGPRGISTIKPAPSTPRGRTNARKWRRARTAPLFYYSSRSRPCPLSILSKLPASTPHEPPARISDATLPLNLNHRLKPSRSQARTTHGATPSLQASPQPP